MFKRLAAAFGPKTTQPDIAALQDSAAKAVAGDVTDLQDCEWEDRTWVYLAINHEISVEDGVRSSTQAAVLVMKPGGVLEQLGFRLSMATKQQLLALRNAMTKAGESPWTILDLTMTPDGRYDFRFSHDQPPRLSGDLLHRPLANLLQRYEEQQQGVRS